MTKCNKCGEWWTAQCPVCFSRERASGSLQPAGYAAAVERGISALESRVELIRRDIEGMPDGIASIMRIGSENDRSAIETLKDMLRHNSGIHETGKFL